MFHGFSVTGFPQLSRTLFLCLRIEYQKEDLVGYHVPDDIKTLLVSFGVPDVAAMADFSMPRKGLEDVSTKYGPTVKGLKRHIRTLTDASIYRRRWPVRSAEYHMGTQPLASVTEDI